MDRSSRCSVKYFAARAGTLAVAFHPAPKGAGFPGGLDKMPMSGSGYNGPVIDSQYTVKRAINQLLDEKQITIDDVRDCVHVIQPILLSMGTNKKHGYTTASKQSRRH